MCSHSKSKKNAFLFIKTDHIFCSMLNTLSLYCPDGTFFQAKPAVQAVLLVYGKIDNALLRAAAFTGSALDTGVADDKSFAAGRCSSKRKPFSYNWSMPKIKELYRPIINTKGFQNVSALTWIHRIHGRIVFKNSVNPFLLRGQLADLAM